MNLIKLIKEELQKLKEENNNNLLSNIPYIKYNGLYSQFNYEELNTIIEFLKAVMIRTNSGTGESISKKSLNKYFFKTPELFRKMFEQKPTNKLWRGDQVNPCDYDNYFENDYYLQSFSNKTTAEFFGEIIFKSTKIKSYEGSFSTVLFNKLNSYKDILYLDSILFYNEFPMYSKLFNIEDFYTIYIILNNYGTLGRKYFNKLRKYLKNNNIDSDSYNSIYSRDGLEIADDESEVMFFNVEYNC